MTLTVYTVTVRRHLSQKDISQPNLNNQELQMKINLKHNLSYFKEINLIPQFSPSIKKRSILTSF